MAKKMAYLVLDEDANEGNIVFSSSEAGARRAGGRLLCEVTEICRCPEADKWSPGPLTKRQYWEAGGFYTACPGCGTEISPPGEGACVVTDRLVYCSEECRKSYEADLAACARKEKRRAQQREHEAATKEN